MLWGHENPHEMSRQWSETLLGQSDGWTQQVSDINIVTCLCQEEKLRQFTIHVSSLRIDLNESYTRIHNKQMLNMSQ